VSPKLDHVFVFRDGTWVRLGDALEHLGHISQVIGVVRLGRRWSESRLDLLIGVNSGGNNLILGALYS